MENYDSEWNPEEDEEEEGDEEERESDDEELSDEDLQDLANALDDEEHIDQLEEELLVREALLEFSFKFSEYIREMDPELWKRAVDYAVTFTKVEGVEFFTEVNGKTGNSEEPPTT